MNEPLKFKLFSIYGQLLNPKILKEAWKQVKKNGGCGGIDKISIKTFEKEEEKYLAEILNELKNKEYKPSPVARKYIPKKNGKLRALGIPTIKDRIVQQALVMKLQPFFEENIFHKNSCGFRPRRGVKDAIWKIVNRIEHQYFYVYDFDIKGYFDNIPHKKLMKVLNKYIADGTVLQMVWKWLKAGYMEDNVRYETHSGTQQGGVISPLLANIYLNELDWELEKANLQFVRYADDGLVMCRSEAELKLAVVVVHEVLEKLGLEIAEDKTNHIDFHKDDFDFLGFTFKHIRESKKGNTYYVVRPSDKSLKKFKSDIKARSCKTCTYSFEKWTEILNPILRGKFNYFLIANEVCLELSKKFNEYGLTFHGIPFNDFNRLDGYVRHRLRVAFSCRGKKHGGQLQGKLLTVKFPNEFFIKDMNLISGEFLLGKKRNPQLSLEEFLNLLSSEHKKIHKSSKNRFFKHAYAK